MFLALIGIWIIFNILTNGIFLSARNLSNLFVQTSYIAILAVGMVLVIVAGHIDLSVGSIAGFTGAIAAILQVNFGWATIPAIGAALAAGLLIGVWQGYWIAYRNIPAFIVTLAGMVAFRGALIAITQGQTIAPLRDDFAALGSGYVPKIVETLKFNDTTLILGLIVILIYVVMDLQSRRKQIAYGFDVPPMSYQILKMVLISSIIAAFFGVLMIYRGMPYAILVVFALVVFYSFLTNNTVFGRQVYALGGNKEAARLSGVNIRSRNMWIFISMGFLSALSGVVFTARLNAAASSAGNLFELDTIAAAIIGGTSTMGGEGTVVGAIIGAVLMASLNNGMSLMNISADWQMIFRGLILLLAVWFDIASRKKGN
ncbi:D-xylose ABC transporter permease [Spirochaeta lutea]|uniref:Xylose transport system permease protein XylH n=2 Tax=Spirochaeta lutea TaxID=1480694 RepID=A0A098QV12_9SPIO|nr:D-xylose ABC transporter permease [Spirochaeta lutea]